MLSASPKALDKFTMAVLRDLMRLPYFTWTHHIDSVKIDGFTLRHKNLYPSFST